MRNRTSLEVMADILRLCGRPKRKTRLLCGAHLSWRMLNQYLDEMQSLGLLEIHHSPTKYLATQKGHNFLKQWKEIVEITRSSNGRLGSAGRGLSIFG